MKIGLLIAAALVAATGTVGTASAATTTQYPRCTSASTSVFGKVKSVYGRTFTLTADDEVGNRQLNKDNFSGTLVVHAARARVHYHGLEIGPGVFTGVAGCFAGANNFDAYEITLAASPQAYFHLRSLNAPDRADRGMQTPGRRTIVGTVVSNGGLTNRVVVALTNGHQIAVFTSELRGARVGDRITATGYVNSRGAFQASSARDLSGR
ncbi:MAG: hypothetical protein M3Z14_01460 [Candidatus Eremiobacteraeota bacterium]|nr:hypothetical protein [Candidatus Eremiobacteraeota bacterium]